MSFVRKVDYLEHIHTDDLDQITESNDSMLDIMERVAIEEITTKISHRYDVVQVFEVKPDWNGATAYIVDDVVYYPTLNKYYKSKTDHTDATTPDVDSTNWDEITDPRNAKIVLSLIDLVLYHLHSRINPTNIPDLRVKRRDDAEMWLIGVRDNKENPTLPGLEDENGVTQGTKINWNSTAKRTNTF